MAGATQVGAARTAEASLAQLAATLGPAQLALLQALPSVTAALTDVAPASGDGRRGGGGSVQAARGEALRSELPGWLTHLARARRRRSAVLGCVQALLAAVFTGANRHSTAARQLYAQVRRLSTHTTQR